MGLEEYVFFVCNFVIKLFIEFLFYGFFDLDVGVYNFVVVMLVVNDMVSYKIFFFEEVYLIKFMW